jgi:hypothetical protein
MSVNLCAVEFHLAEFCGPFNLGTAIISIANQGSSMKAAAIVLLSAGFAFAIAVPAVFAATTDDVKWINECVKDNKGEATDEIILKYCTCMNNKMSDNESRSITEWEKTHETERKACDKESGWK